MPPLPYEYYMLVRFVATIVFIVSAYRYCGKGQGSYYE
ncbi:DUF6804 family protein [Leyella stercorea]